MTDQILDLMKHVAATIVTPRFRALANDEIDEKRPGDYVTIADRESEEALTAALTGMHPGALIVGEEASFTNPRLLAALPLADHAFVVDPVDGTRNFVQGNPDHAVMVSELRGGEAVRAWIWQPEHQTAYVSERGSGVWRDDERLAPIPRGPRPRVRASNRNLVGIDEPVLAEPIRWTWFCCGIDYPKLLTNEVDALVYGPPKPWDHAGCSLMVRELGGVVRLLDGTEYSAGTHGPRLVAAADPALWDIARSVLPDA